MLGALCNAGFWNPPSILLPALLWYWVVSTVTWEQIQKLSWMADQVCSRDPHPLPEQLLKPDKPTPQTLQSNPSHGCKGICHSFHVNHFTSKAHVQSLAPNKPVHDSTEERTAGVSDASKCSWGAGCSLHRLVGRSLKQVICLPCSDSPDTSDLAPCQ